MKLRCQTWNNEILIEELKNIVALIPPQGLYLSSNLVEPYVGVVPYRGELLPVRGPVPAEKSGPLLIYKDYAQALKQVPDFLE